MTHDLLAPIAGVLETHYWAGATPEPSILLEIPHGATRTSDYEALHRQLRGPLPDQLDHFFYVNTDIGAPEGAMWLGEALAAAGRSVLLLRCTIPRTFIDCNRVAELRNPSGRVEAGITPAVAAYIRDPDDTNLLNDLHRRYQAHVDQAYAWVCGRGGMGMQVHTYSPRSVGISVIDDNIVTALHAAYEPEVYNTWPERPPVDLITATASGEMLADPALVASICRGYANLGLNAQQNATYHLHPATLGYHYARRYPQRTLCVEFRRDLLADPFVPFGPSPISPGKVARMFEVLRAALLAHP